MTVAQEFESPKSKLARARHHISGLESEIQKLIAGIRVERIIEPITPSHGSLYDRWLRKYAHDCAMEGRAPQEPPDATAYVHKIHFQSLDISNLEPVAGDAIQNLRQALDHAACSCARSINKTDKSTFFPLVERPDQLEARMKDQASKLPPSIKDIIRKSEPGGGLLYELHSLGGGDKHRLTCSFVRQAISAPAFMKAGPGWIGSGFGSDEWDAINNDIRYAMTSSPDEVNYQFRFGIEIRFNASGIISTKPVLPALNEIADTVAGIIGEMEIEMTRLLSTS